METASICSNGNARFQVRKDLHGREVSTNWWWNSQRTIQISLQNASSPQCYSILISTPQERFAYRYWMKMKTGGHRWLSLNCWLESKIWWTTQMKRVQPKLIRIYCSRRTKQSITIEFANKLKNAFQSDRFESKFSNWKNNFLNSLKKW